MKLKAFGSTKADNLREAALVPEVLTAVRAWVVATDDVQTPGVLIGGLALAFYARPRTTQDVDMLFLSDADIPDTVPGFKRYRKMAFRDNKNHVDIELVTAEHVSIPQSVVRKVVQTSKLLSHDGIRIASLEGMIALKLYGALNPKRELRDSADIQAMLEDNPAFKPKDMDDWSLPKALRDRLIDLHKKSRL